MKGGERIEAQVLELAHRYEVSGLIERQVARLMAGLTAENAADAFALSERFQLPRLKDAVITFLAADKSRVATMFKSAAYGALSKEQVTSVVGAVVA